MSTNEYGLDVTYFESKFKRILNEIDRYTPSELARECARMASAADSSVLLEKEFIQTKKEFFVYCPNSGFEKFDNVNDREQHAEDCIQGYLNDGWDEEVAEVCSGVITHYATQTDLTKRPDDIDEDGCDGLGVYWAEWDYTCNYQLLPVYSNREKNS